LSSALKLVRCDIVPISINTAPGWARSPALRTTVLLEPGPSHRIGWRWRSASAALGLGILFVRRVLRRVRAGCSSTADRGGEAIVTAIEHNVRGGVRAKPAGCSSVRTRRWFLSIRRSFPR
jgi:hypothetical protein